MDILKALKAKLDALFNQLPSYMKMSDAIYSAAVSDLHKSITLNSSVPSDLGCAEAVSYVLRQANVSGIPAGGFPGTAGLYSWLQSNPLFVLVDVPEAGDIVISPTGTSSKNTPHGHTGIVAKQGILSNDSDTGLFLEKYTLLTWKQYFGDTLGFPIYYFRCY